MLNIKGQGVSIYKAEHVGILLDVKPRTGTYIYKDKETGEKFERPNSWDAIFADGTKVSWPAYVDQEGEVKPWDRFDPSIDLEECRDNGIAIHLFRNEEGYFRLEIAK